ncbi:MAG: hypothetical protein PHX43_08910 [Alphaproteobacteria bacterium]|nr:hypothetical protein [Alphaproteobacteria bacterium]
MKTARNLAEKDHGHHNYEPTRRGAYDALLGPNEIAGLRTTGFGVAGRATHELRPH